MCQFIFKLNNMIASISILSFSFLIFFREEFNVLTRYHKHVRPTCIFYLLLEFFSNLSSAMSTRVALIDPQLD